MAGKVCVQSVHLFLGKLKLHTKLVLETVLEVFPLTFICYYHSQ